MEPFWIIITLFFITMHHFKGTGSTFSRIACDGEYLSLECSDGLRIHILDANFGRTEVEPCGGNSSVTSCVMPGVQDIIKVFCETSYACRILSSATVFEDPCPNITKYLNVTFECVGGTTKESITSPDPPSTPDITSPSPTSASDITSPLSVDTQVSPAQTTCSCAECWKLNRPSSVDLAVNPAILEAITKNITAELKIDKKTLSSTIRRSISARDDRVTATFMGYIGVAVLTVVFGIIVFTDVINIVIPSIRGQRTLLYEREI